MEPSQSFNLGYPHIPTDWEEVPQFSDDEAAEDHKIDLTENLDVSGNTDDLISLISHELRTPLTSISGAIGLLMSGKLGEISTQGQRMLEIALSNTDRLVRLTNMIESNPETQAKILTMQDLERLRLGNDLRSAVASALRSSTSPEINPSENQELELNYQPIIFLPTGAITGFEALARWCNPRLGIISPAEFIPIAEETKLINSLGLWVLRTACQQLHEWQQEFPRQSSLSMSVNVSGIQLAEPDFISQVQLVLADYPLLPNSLRLEITESVLMENKQVVLDNLKQLKALGIKLYIDDFGTGYSSLSRLYELPLDVLKIDQSFIREEKWDLIYTLMLLAQSQRLGVIAEGVETKDQSNCLKNLGCAEAQGYLFSEPLNKITAAKLLADKVEFITSQ